MTKTVSTAAPAHLGLLAALLLVWHGLLAADYLIIRLSMHFDLPSLDAALEGSAIWAQIGWAMGVWLGLAAAISALLRDDAAVLLFFAAFCGMVAAVVGAELAEPPAELLGLPRYAVFGALVLVPLVGWIYARTMKRAGVLH
jgi:hypothetical protein